MNLTNGKYNHIGHSVVTISPRMAEEYLEKNTVNRPLPVGGVEKITRDLLGGQWHLNGQSIVIAKTGRIMDGQTRLWACVESGVPITTILITGVDEDAIVTIDSGKPRSWGDQFTIANKLEGKSVQYVTNLQAALKNLHWYETAWPALHSGAKKNASFSELNSLLERHPGFKDAIAACCSSSLITRLGSSSVTSTVYGLASEKYPNEARGWLEVLKNGEGDPGNPAIVLREKMIAKSLAGPKLDINTKFVYFIKSWNAFAQGEEIAGLRWGKDEPMPAIYGTPQYTGKYAAHTAILKKVKAAPSTAKGSVARAGKRR